MTYERLARGPGSASGVGSLCSRQALAPALPAKGGARTVLSCRALWADLQCRVHHVAQCRGPGLRSLGASRRAGTELRHQIGVTVNIS